MPHDPGRSRCTGRGPASSLPLRDRRVHVETNRRGLCPFCTQHSTTNPRRRQTTSSLAERTIERANLDLSAIPRHHHARVKARIVGLLAALTAQATRTPRALRGDISKAALAAMANTNRAAYLAPLVAVHIIAEELGQSTPTPEAGGARRRETDGPTGPTSRYSVQCIQCGGARPVPSARRVSALCPACKDTRTTKRRNVDTA